MRYLPFVSALGLMALSTTAHAEPRFFLSTDHVFAPGEEGAIRLEARDTPYLDMRVYKLEDPVSYLRGLSDPHRPAVERGKRRVSVLTMFSEGYRRTASGLFRNFRDSLKSKGRKLGNQAFGETVGELSHISRSSPDAPNVPPLRDFPLVDRFDWGQAPGKADAIPFGGEQMNGGWRVDEVFLPALEAGVYLVEAVNQFEGAHTVVVVSDLALVLKQGPKKMLSYVVERKTGEPIKGAQVDIYVGKAQRDGGKTNGQGLWETPLKSSKSLVVAKKGDSYAVYDPRYFPAGLNDRRGYLFTDRPAYRPGHMVQFKGWLRDRVETGYKQPKKNSTARITVFDARGASVSTSTAKMKSGAFDGKFTLSKDAAMGRYRVVAQVGDESFGGEFKVKAYKKPEYKVTITTEKGAYRVGEKVNASIKGAFFYGAPLPDAKVKWEVYRTRFYVPWWVDADYSWYYSESEVRNTRRELVGQGEGTLSDDGLLEINFETKQDSTDFTYVVEAQVTGESGRAIAGRKSFRVTKGAFRLSVSTAKLVTKPGDAISTALKAVDYAGKVISNQEVSLSVVALSTDGTQEQLSVRKGKTNKKGEWVVDLVIPKRGYFKIIAKATDVAGSEITAERIAFAADDSGKGINFVPGQLELVADKQIYSEGDRARFLILAPYANGKMLVTTEGGSLFDKEVVEVKNYVAMYSVKIGAAQTPNFFLGLSGIYDGELYSLTRSVVVPPASAFLNVSISSDKEQYEPGDEGVFKFKVTNNKGKPVSAELAISVVDEKIYSISPEIAAPIQQFFYPKKRNNVRLGTSTDFRFYGYARDLRQQSASLKPVNPFQRGAPKNIAQAVRRNFVDTLDWKPTLLTNARGKATLKVRFADNLTSWRVTARAMTKQAHVGMAKHNVRTRKDLIVEVAAPIFATVGDSVSMTAMARNYAQKKTQVSVSLKADGAHAGQLKGDEASKDVAPRKSLSATYIFSPTKAGVFKFIATGTGAVNDSKQISIAVLPYGTPEINAVAGVLHAGEASSQEIQLALPAGASVESAYLNLSAGTGLASAVISSLEYLAEFPYGCAEQTMSRFLPNLVASRALRDLGIKNAALEKKLPEHISAGLSRLISLQNRDGGWGWWSEDRSEPYLTAHVMYGLTAARSLGQFVPKEVYRRGMMRLKKQAALPAVGANTRA